jgi:hypothetical protein
MKCNMLDYHFHCMNESTIKLFVFKKYEYESQELLVSFYKFYNLFST